MLAETHGEKLDFVYWNSRSAWLQEIHAYQRELSKSFAREWARANRPFPPELVEQIEEARRERGRNKAREHQRELAGEIIKRTHQRARRGPPPHVLMRMSPLRRYYDRVARSSVTEVGYVGWVKKKLGFKLKNPDPFEAEDGEPGMQAELDEWEKKLVAENQRRRTRAWRRAVRRRLLKAASPADASSQTDEQKSA